MNLDTLARPMPERVLRFHFGDQPFAADLRGLTDLQGSLTGTVVDAVDDVHEVGPVQLLELAGLFGSAQRH